MSDARLNSSTGEQPYLTFELGGEQYALAISDVIEVAAMVEPTRLASAPAGIIGMINRHGEPILLLDLRFVTRDKAQPDTGQDQPQPYTSSSLFIVIQPEQPEPQTGSRYGVLVDKVHQVEYFTENARTALPGPGNRLIQAIVMSQDRLIQIINPGHVIRAILGQESVSITAYQSDRTALPDTAILRSVDH